MAKVCEEAHRRSGSRPLWQSLTCQGIENSSGAAALILAATTPPPMALVICPKCEHQFNPRDVTVPKVTVAAALGMGGAYIGSSVGLAGGPFGAMAGTIPGGIIGGVVGYLGAARFT